MLARMTAFLDRDWGDAALADFSAMVFPALLQSVAAAWLSPAEAGEPRECCAAFDSRAPRR